jgi:alkaline phosphatase D
MFLVGSVVVAAGAVISACSSDDASAPASTEPENTQSATTAATQPTTTEPATTPPADTQPPVTEPASTLPVPELSGDPFTLGVASGDPDTSSVVLWTRLAPDPLHGGGMPDADVGVAWELSSDVDFGTIVASGTAIATAEHAHSVHVVAAPAAPTSNQLYYRFRVGPYTSPTGRTRIAPTGAVSSTTFVSASCQNYEDGFYTAHRDIAAQPLDFLVWLGDYIYEGASQDIGVGGSVRSHGAPEPMDLPGYRDRYALYKMDPHLQAAHHACPWFVIWDDHEVENNYAGITPQDPADAAGFAVRRQAAYQAWWEHQPVRLDPPAASGEYRIYRAVTWGDLIGMALLDTRQYRTDQACGDVTFSLDPPCPEVEDDDRTLTGTEQEAWLFDTVGKQGTTWNVIAQQIVMADISLNGAILNYDQWDGYPKDRQRILQHLHDEQVPNAIVLSGDIHLAGVAVLEAGASRGGGDGTPVAVEFVDTSISSAGLVPPDTVGLVKSFKEIVDAELAHRGYTMHTVTPDTWTAAYRIVESALVPESTVSTFATYVVDAGAPAVRIEA